MNKETFYFSHDYNARSDPKLVRLVMNEGMIGLGIYWSVIEMLYEQNGYIELKNIENIAFELHSECDRITNVLKNHDLFKFKDNKFYSDSVLRRLKIRNAKSAKTKQSALKRWYPERYKDAIVLPSQSESNAIKVKENKVKENGELSNRELKFKSEVFEYLDKYPESLLNSFCNYWTEKNKSKTKMRFELEKTFEISKRLATWASRDKNFDKNKMSIKEMLDERERTRS
ncbi:MAG: DUF4373 domain-containing protein [Bacteroidales bacterium]|nr:DUF4373 domain-containing protein [Bacteroidales bacterium]